MSKACLQNQPSSVAFSALAGDVGEKSCADDGAGEAFPRATKVYTGHARTRVTMVSMQQRVLEQMPSPFSCGQSILTLECRHLNSWLHEADPPEQVNCIY
jgi:hypothetical protein